MNQRNKGWKENLNFFAAMINISMPIIAGLFFIMEINSHNKVQDERISATNQRQDERYADLNERITGIQNDVAEIKKEFLESRVDG